MNKTLFEKLAYAGRHITLEQSVVSNIQNILRARQYLDGDQLSDELSPKEIVDQSSGSSMDAEQYTHRLQNIILRFEPRVEKVEVKNLDYNGLKASCVMKLVLTGGSLEQEFTF